MVIWAVWSCTGNPIDFLRIVSIYGYSMTVFIPTILLCALPSKFL